MATTNTDRLLMVKPDGAELINIGVLTANMDKTDSDFRPEAKMTASANQSVANNTVVAVAYNVTEYDSYAARAEGAMVNLSTDTITIRKAGLYLIKNKITWAPHATGVRRLDINKNAGLIHTHAIQGFTGANNTMYMSETEVLAVNDTISANCFQGSGAALNAEFATEGITLSVHWLGNIS